MKPLVSIKIVAEYRLEIFEMPYMEIFQIAQLQRKSIVGLFDSFNFRTEGQFSLQFLTFWEELREMGKVKRLENRQSFENFQLFNLSFNLLFNVWE